MSISPDGLGMSGAIGGSVRLLSVHCNLLVAEMLLQLGVKGVQHLLGGGGEVSVVAPECSERERQGEKDMVSAGLENGEG